MRVNGQQLRKQDERIIIEAEQEIKRRGKFELVYPSTISNIYQTYFDEKRPLNSILYKRCIE